MYPFPVSTIPDVVNLQNNNNDTPPPPPPPPQEDKSVINQIVNGLNEISDQVGILNNWTVGGSAVIGNIMGIMFENITKKSDLADTDFEDLLQLAYLDMKKRGTLPDTLPNNISYVLEAAGSGNHTSGAYLTGDDMKSIFDAAGNEPTTSLAYKVYNYIKNINNKSLSFDDFIKNYETNFWKSPQGFMDGSVGEANNDLAPIIPPSQQYCPWVRLLILSTYIHLHPQTTNEDYMAIINGDSTTIKNLLGLKGNDKIVDWLIKNQSPDLAGTLQAYNTEQTPEKNGVIIDQGFLDVLGGGVSMTFIDSLLTKFPSRVLTDDEVRNVNRYGDQAKILYELLKYKLKTGQDTRMQITQNI